MGLVPGGGSDPEVYLLYDQLRQLWEGWYKKRKHRESFHGLDGNSEVEALEQVLTFLWFTHSQAMKKKQVSPSHEAIVEGLRKMHEEVGTPEAGSGAADAPGVGRSSPLPPAATAVAERGAARGQKTV